ncbi:MAG: hypothetical protein QS748_02460, partial [Candidatus Endonucleobacter bathymodioli]|nr:hypothetical protein [Candidatus Endonucleobacter bathymodioli]
QTTSIRDSLDKHNSRKNTANEPFKASYHSTNSAYYSESNLQDTLFSFFCKQILLDSSCLSSNPSLFFSALLIFGISGEFRKTALKPRIFNGPWYLGECRSTFIR